jgi:hypothetical protein
MQMHWSAGFFKRMLYNIAKVYSRQRVSKKKPYSTLKPVYGLALLNDTFDDKSNYYHHYRFVDYDNNDDKLDDMQLVVVELPKFVPTTLTAKKMTILWLRFLNETEGEHEIPRELIENEDIGRAVEMCRKAAFSKEELSYYERLEDALISYYTMVYDAKKDALAIIEEQNKALEKKNKALEKKNKALEKKDKALEKQNKALEKKDKALEKKDKALEEKDLEIKRLLEKLKNK